MTQNNSLGERLTWAVFLKHDCKPCLMPQRASTPVQEGLSIMCFVLFQMKNPLNVLSVNRHSGRAVALNSM